MKKITVLALISLLTLVSLCSCGVTDLFVKTTSNVSVLTTAASPVSTVAKEPVEEPTTNEMNFVGMDLSGYITLDYKDLEFKTSCEKRVITDEILDAEIHEYLVSQKNYTLEKSGVTKSGAYIEINYEGYMDGEQFSGGTSEKQTILLDDDNSGYIPGFAAGLIGKEIGTVVELNLTFPSNYYSTLAGKEVLFKVTINGVCKTELTDATASSITSGKYQTVAEYRVFLKEYLEALDESSQFSEVKQQVYDKLDEICVVKSLPEQQVQYYYEQTIYSIKTYANKSNKTYETYLAELGYTEEMLRKECEQYTKYDLILYYIANTENIIVTDEEVDEYIDGIVDYYVNLYNQQGYSYSADSLKSYYKSQYSDEEIRYQAQQEKVAQCVFKYANVIYDPTFVLDTNS